MNDLILGVDYELLVISEIMNVNDVGHVSCVVHFRFKCTLGHGWFLLNGGFDLAVNKL